MERSPPAAVAFEPDKTVQDEIDRVVQIWEHCRDLYGSGGPFLFGAFSIADCMYAPVAMRFRTYNLRLSAVASSYCEAVASWPAMVQWVESAKSEKARIAQYEQQSRSVETTDAVPPLRFLGDAQLMQPQAEMRVADVGTEACQEIVSTLRRAMKHYGGIGIAAPQIGLWTRVFVFGVDGSNPRYAGAESVPFQVWVNPRITWASAETNWMWEGCLSVPGLRGWVERPREVRLIGIDEHGTEREVALTGLPARIAQHELDHLDGVCFPQRTPGAAFIVPQASMDAREEWAAKWPSDGSRRTALGKLSDTR